MYWLTAVLGVALGIAPFLLGYRDQPVAMWTSIVLGVVVAILSLIEAMDERAHKWENWAVGAAGLLAIIAPFAFGFTTLTMAMWVTIGFGLLVLLIAGYEVFTEQTSVQ